LLQGKSKMNNNPKIPPPQKVNFGAPPPDYVAGWGRGAIGFITRSDIGPSKMGGDTPAFGAPPSNYVAGMGRGAAGGNRGDDDERADYSDTKFDNWLGYEGSLFAGGADYDEEDREAEDAYSRIDNYMDTRRRDRREKKYAQEMEKYRKEKPTITEQLKDAKRQLSTLSYDDWMSIPDATGGPKGKQVKRAEKYIPVPDKILDSARRDSETVTSITPTESTRGNLTNLTELGGARSTVISVKLDRISDSVTGQSVVDPKGYLTSLNSNSILGSDADIGDWKKTRLLLKSAIETNPKVAPSWIAAARVEELDGKLQAARSFIAQGLQHCQDSEDLWLEAARLEPPEKAKSILAKAVTHLPRSVKIWRAAADKENENATKKKILKRALEYNSTDLDLWKQLIELGSEDEARELLHTAVKCIPNQLELWLALAKLETYENARVVLNDARKALPKEFSIWVYAAKLDEAQGNVENVDAVIKRGIKVLTKEGIALGREEWLKEAQTAEKAGSILTCDAIIRATADLGVDEDEKEKTWIEDAETCIPEKCFETARALYKHAASVFPTHQSIWLIRIEFEKKYGNNEILNQVLEQAITDCPNYEVFWLMAAKHKWQTIGVDSAREVLTRAFSVHPNSENVYLAAAKLERETRQYERAREIYVLARNNCNTPKVWMQSAQLEREVGNDQEAFKLASEGIKAHPNFPKLWMIAGQIQEKLGRKEEAREIYDKGTTLNKTAVALWICLIELDAKAGNFAKARSIWEKARIKNPNSSELWYYAVKLEERDGNPKGAKYMLSKGLQECPKNGELWALAIEIEPRHLRTAKSVEAMKNCDNDPYVILAVAKLFWKEKKFDKTEKWLERCVLVNGDYGDAWVYYYKFLKDRNQQRDADEILRRCKEADPHHGRLWISISKRVENWRLSTEEILLKAVDQIGMEFELIE